MHLASEKPAAMIVIKERVGDQQAPGINYPLFVHWANSCFLNNC